jgi:hypothetical protein
MNLSTGLKISALVLMLLITAFFAFMGIGEMLGGDLSGMGHLPPVVLIAFMMWLGWKKPLAGGLTMSLLGVLISIYFFIVVNRPADRPIAMLIMGGPFLLFGLLFLFAALIERSKQTQKI